ncbi:hypothetical protein MOXK02_17800 [Moraxella sp. K02]
MLVQGHKKGESNPRTPVIAQDSVSSVQTVKILYGLAEGEIAGLANGAESIRLEKTPIRTNGVDNFKNVSFDVRNGTNDQSHIAGFDSVVNEIGVSVELRHDRPFTRAFTNLQLSAVAVRLKWDRLAQTNGSNGDVSGYRIDYAIDVMTDGGAWIEVLSTKIEDKASAGYVRTHRIDLPKAKTGWQIRVRRITPNSTSDLISDKMYVDAVQEIIDSKLRYPNTALLALQYDAKSFQNVAKVAVRLKGKIIRVPSNYNAQSRTYSGLWDGTFIEAYSNNPAWVFYDLCLSKRYGIGSRLDASMVDKWSLYEMGRYCDELVDDGKGGKEPRFTVNVYLQKTEDAYNVLSQLAGVFRALSYWNGQSIVVNADVPKDPVFTYSRANVVDGAFKYTGSRARDRHTVVKVAWDDPNNDFETDYEWVKDEEAIARLGIRQLDMSAFGCTSQAQAYRVGQWALLSEQLETQQVSFKTGLDGFIPQVGDIINISDEIFAGRANGGRVSAINNAKDAVTLDRDVVAKVGDTLLINGADATETRAIVAVNGRVITVDKPFDSIEPQHVWAINSPDLQLMQFRVMSITKDDETFTITGVQYEPKKFAGIESSVKVTPRKITVNDAYRIDAPGFVNLSQSIATHQGQAVTTLTISWGQVAMASHYQVEWRKDGGNWIVMPKQTGVSADIVGVYAGQYEARVTAISPFDVASLATNSALTTITGKQGKPPALANIKAVGKLFGMDVSWVFANGSSDANYTEIQVASNANGSDAVLLGMYSYPTNNTTINGLQGNLTQYYRGRIVDKLGNVSDWSNWVSGMTDASADKVLTLLSGQITQTQLAQDLAAPIGKIPTLEAGVAKIPALEIGVSKIPSIETSVNAISQNLSVTNANLASETAKLNAAVADIEKSKQAIANAVVDVDTLKKDGADFKQEISGIKSQQNALSSEIQTINNSYASADLALSQRIDTIKSASDKAAADITTINQTKIDANQAQAIATTTTNAKFDALAVGGRNLLIQSRLQEGYFDPSNGVAVGTYPDAHDPNYYPCKAGDVFVGTVYDHNGVTNIGITGIICFYDQNKANIANYPIVGHNVGDTLKATAPANTVFYRVATTAKGIKAKIEKGNIATDWTPAPEDIDAKIATTDATINEFKQTQATTDSATAERINSIDAAYKSADGQTNAKVATLEKTVSDADSALSQRISSLDASYKSDNATTNARIAAEETARANADSATAQRVETLESSTSQAASRIASLEKTSSDNTQAIATAEKQLTAKFDALAVGGRNLLIQSRLQEGYFDPSNGVAVGTYPDAHDPNYYPCKAGDVFVGTVYDHNGVTNIGITGIICFYDQNKANIANYPIVGHNVGDTLKATAPANTVFYRVATTAKGIKAKIEKGNIATDWTPAPEDIDAKIATTDATINEFKQTQATTDSATAERINSIDAAYKSADGQTNAKVATLEKTVSDADSALSQRISSLDASYKSDNATTNARIAAEETARANADSATAQRVETLESSTSQAASRIASLEKTSSDNTQAIATAEKQLTAKFDALAVGGRNLLIQSRLQEGYFDPSNGVAVGTYPDAHDPNYYPCKAGDVFVGTVYDHNGVTNIGITGIICFYDQNKANIANYPIVGHNVGDTLKATAPANTVFYRVATTAKGIKAKIEKGNIATDWTPAPEDIDAKIATTDATINEFKQTQATKDSATAERINSIDAAYKSADGQTNAKVATLEKTVSDADSALSQRISSLDASYKSDNATTNARIAAEETARANADSATAQRVETLESSTSQAASRIASLEKTSSDNTQAIATAEKQLTAKFDALAVGGRNLLIQSRLQEGYFDPSNGVAVGTYPDAHDPNYYPCKAGDVFVGTVYDHNGVTNIGITGIICFYDQNKANIANYPIVGHNVGDTLKATAPANTVFYRVATTAKGIKAKIEKGNIATDWTPAPEDIDAKIATTDATINEFKQTQATKDSATATQLSTLQTSVAGNTASIQTQQKSIDGLYVQWSIKVDVNGHIAGVGLANTGVLSSFIVNADDFYVSSPGGGKGVSPFMILNSPQVINGVTVPTGTYIKSAFIHDGSIDSAKIKDAAITSAKIGDAQITTAKIGTAQVDTLQIKGQAVSVTTAINQTSYYDFGSTPTTDSLYLDTNGASTAVEFSLISCNPDGAGSFTVECFVNDVQQGIWTIKGTFGYYPNMFFPFLVSTNTGTTKIRIKITGNGTRIGAAGYFLKATALKR